MLTIMRLFVKGGMCGVYVPMKERSAVEWPKCLFERIGFFSKRAKDSWRECRCVPS